MLETAVHRDREHVYKKIIFKRRGMKRNPEESMRGKRKRERTEIAQQSRGRAVPLHFSHFYGQKTTVNKQRST